MSLALVIRELSTGQRAVLVEWQKQLGQLIERRRCCRARTVRGALGVQFEATLRGAQEAIAETCRPAHRDLLQGASQTIERYFSHAGDARAAAATFHAFRELDAVMRGPAPEENFADLARQAEEASTLIERILGGEAVWTFTGASA